MFTLFNQGFLSTLITHMDSSARLAMLIAGIVLCALIGYLLGSLNFALILSGKMYKDDIRKHGSKNAGTTNMMRTYGNKAAGLTILGDMLKAVVAVILGALILGLYYGGYAAACYSRATFRSARCLVLQYFRLSPSTPASAKRIFLQAAALRFFARLSSPLSSLSSTMQTSRVLRTERNPNFPSRRAKKQKNN